jgi:ribonuclease P protein component
VSKQFTLGKKERLKSRKLIEQLFSEGKGFVVAPFKVYYLIPEKTPTTHHSPVTQSLSKGTTQFGVGVSAKNFKKAVDRNRIKRLTRESYRLQKNSLHEKVASKNIQLNIFFIYTGKELPGYDEVYKKVGSALIKLDKLIDSV